MYDEEYWLERNLYPWLDDPTYEEETCGYYGDDDGHCNGDCCMECGCELSDEDDECPGCGVAF